MFQNLYNSLLKYVDKLIPYFPSSNDKINEWKKNQSQFFESYANFTPNSILFIVASSGEFEQAIPLIECIKEKHPNDIITISFFSPSGYNAHIYSNHIDQVTYTPLDNPKKVKRFIDHLQPKFVFFVKYELWLNLMISLREFNIPRVLFSAVFPSSHFIFKWFGKLHRSELKSFSEIFVQNQESVKNLEKFDISSILAGDTRIDRSLELPETAFTDPVFEKLTPQKIQLIVGSSWPSDLEKFKEIRPFLAENNIQLLIFPHEIYDEELHRIKDIFSATLYSQITVESPEIQEHLVVDKMGLLKYAYRYADIAYVGGGFGKGIHNTLEPAAYGIPIIFGPKYEKFIEAKDLIDLQAAYTVNDRFELQEALQNLLEKSHRKQMGTAAFTYLKENEGAAQKIYKTVSEKYPKIFDQAIDDIHE